MRKIILSLIIAFLTFLSAHEVRAVTAGDPCPGYGVMTCDNAEPQRYYECVSIGGTYGWTWGECGGSSQCNPEATSRMNACKDFTEADSEFLYQVNPLTIQGNNLLGTLTGIFLVNYFVTPSSFVNRALLFLFPLAGIILFVMIVWGGFEMLYGASDTKAQEAGKQRITAALIGFILLFVSFWIAQIVQTIFGVNSLG